MAIYNHMSKVLAALDIDSPELKKYDKTDQLIIKSTVVFIVIGLVLLTLYMVGILGSNLGVSLLTIVGVTISSIAYDQWKMI